MRGFFILLLVIAGAGCSNDTKSEEIKDLSQNINEEMGIDVYLPHFDDLDISFAYVSYRNDNEPRSIDIQYSKSVDEEVIDNMDNPNINILYGPYSQDVVIFFAIDINNNNINNVSEERFQVYDTEVVIQEAVDSFNNQPHMFIINNNRYSISYNLDYFTEEEALEHTEEIVSDILN